MNQSNIDKKRRSFIEQAPDLYKAPLERLYFGTGQKSRALAVKLKCLDCCCFQREEVRRCPVASCPLWGLRPFQMAEEGGDDE